MEKVAGSFRVGSSPVSMNLLWILNSKTNNVYLARSGSTIFADFLTNNFSSVKYSDYKPLEEGVLYLQTVEGLTSVGKFKSNSPFFTA